MFFKYFGLIFNVAAILLAIVELNHAMILRLSCKEVAEFAVVKAGRVLEGSVIASYKGSDAEKCKDLCVFHHSQCKSINIQLADEKVCQLNNRTIVDVRFGFDNFLTTKTGWSFMATDYTDPYVGENCKQLRPCRKDVLCTDTCECTGYQCHECAPNKTGFHCHDWKDCSEVKRSGHLTNEVYNILASPKQSIPVFCDMSTTTTDGWIVIQRRIDASVNFARDWNDYKRGFGDIRGNYWIGLEKLHMLASPGRGAKLRVDLKIHGTPIRSLYAEYSMIEIGNEADDYRLNVQGYSGTAGDALAHCSGYYQYGCSVGMKFYTRDRRAHNTISTYNCGERFHSGWWHRNCVNANLNGLFYGDTSDTGMLTHMSWYSPEHPTSDDVIFSEMKIKYS